MRPASAGLKSFLISRQPFFSADLFTFTLSNGNQLLMTSSDFNITYGATTWLAAGPVVSRSRWSVKNTLEVPTLEVNLLSNGADYSSQNIKSLIIQGLLDGCQLLLQRAFMPTPFDTSLGIVTLFGGIAGPIELSSTGAKITFKGSNVKLQAYMPRNRYQAGCVHALYDAGCTLNRALFTATNTVGSGSNNNTIFWGTVPANPSNYTQGYVLFTSGINAGLKRTISNANPLGINLAYPVPDVSAVGDTIAVTFGCDKTRDGANGCAFFSNQQHFRGFMYIPPAEIGL